MQHRPVWLALNKVDLIEPTRLLPLAQELNALLPVEETFMISAEKKRGLDKLLDRLAAAMPPGPYLFPEDELSDLPNRMLVAEIVREQILRQTHEEVPHHATVETESWQEKKDGSVRVDCTIYVGRPTQKAILIGDGGARIKEIGQRARKELEALLERRVHLFLNVKDRPGWDEERGRIRALGLEDEGSGELGEYLLPTLPKSPWLRGTARSAPHYSPPPPAPPRYARPAPAPAVPASPRHAPCGTRWWRSAAAPRASPPPARHPAPGSAGGRSPRSTRQIRAQGTPAAFSLSSHAAASAAASAPSITPRRTGMFSSRRNQLAEARVIQRILAADRRHQRPVLLLGIGGEQQVAVPRHEQVGGGAPADRLVAPLPLLVTGDRPIGHLAAEEGQVKFQHRHVELLAAPGMGRWNSAEDTAKAAVMPESWSQMAKPARSGSAPGARSSP